MSDIYQMIAQKIKELRQNYPGSLSQEELAKHLNVSPNTLSRWETGTYKPTAENLDHLARFFKVSITTFFPDQKSDNSRAAALASATGALSEADFDEVMRYAEFRRARSLLENEKKKKAKKKG